MPHVVRSCLRSECVADFVIDRAWEPSEYDVPTDTLQGITQPVDALPPSMANDMRTIRADAWKVGIKRWPFGSVSSPWKVLGKFVSHRHSSTTLNGICAGQRPYAHHCQRLSIMRGQFEMYYDL